MARIDDLTAWKASGLTGGGWKLGPTGGASLPYIAALPIRTTKQNLLLISRRKKPPISNPEVPNPDRGCADGASCP